MKGDVEGLDLIIHVNRGAFRYLLLCFTVVSELHHILRSPAFSTGEAFSFLPKIVSPFLYLPHINILQ